MAGCLTARFGRRHGTPFLFTSRSSTGGAPGAAERERRTGTS